MSKSKSDRLLDNLEKVIGFSSLSLIGLISYFFVNVEHLSTIKMYVLLAGLAFTSLSSIFLGIYYKKIFDKLE